MVETTVPLSPLVRLPRKRLYSELALGGDSSPQLLRKIECSHPSIPSLVCQKKRELTQNRWQFYRGICVLTHWNLGVPMGTLYFGKTYQMTSEQFFNLRICKN